VSDVQELRDLAQRMRELAARARNASSQLRSAQGVDFVSNAADRYREDLRHHAGGTDDAANQLDDAARALVEHATYVEHTLAKIKSIEKWFGNRLDDAKREVAGAADKLSHAASDILDHASRAPSPGSPDWIEFGRRWHL
jgi:hypothetical protein